MTEDEKKRFNEMEQDIKHIAEQSEANAVKLDQILTALTGDPISGNIGLTARVALLEKDVKDLREERVKNTIYVKIITWLLGIIATGVIGYILSLIFLKAKT